MIRPPCPALAPLVFLGLFGSTLADEPNRPTAPASEKNPAVPAAGHSLHGESFDEGPRQRAYLKEGQGKVDFDVTTAKPEARAFVNQGVAQLHSFYYLEAERSFRQAAQIDPDGPMAYWGMAMANVNNAKRARGFNAEAQKKARSTKVSPRERLYLDALNALYKDNGKNDAAFLAGFEAIVQEFPDDLDARVWLAMLIWQNGNVGVSRQAVDGLLQYVEKVNPLHPGVHHYRIHLWDGNKPIRAEKSAGLFARSAPGIAHAWHMPGHTFTGLQRYADAAYQQEGSARVDHAAMLRDRIMPFEIHNYAHNNQWLATSLSHVGRVKEAIAVARNLVEQPRDPRKNGKNDGGSPQRSGRARWSELLVRYELWDDLIAATTSGALDWSDVPQEKREKAYTLGLAYAAKGDKAKLAEQIAALKGLEPKPNPSPASAPPASSPSGGRNGRGQAGNAVAPPTTAPPATASISPEMAELEGYRKLLDEDVTGAFESFGKASRMRGEALARAHIQARNFGYAPAAAKKAADDGPNQVVPLAAYVEILHLCGKVKDAQDAYRKLEPLARHADRDSPVFRRLAPIVAAWKVEAGWQGEAQKPEVGESSDHRVDPSSLGPLTWSPYAAEPIAGVDTEGKPWSLAERKGKNVLVLFYLGGKCAHCMQQLELIGKEIEALRARNTEVVAISTDAPEGTKALKANADGIKFPMPLLSDPKMDLFRAYRAFDDFEDSPMHGTFLIDVGGGVRFQRIGPEPFLDVEFLKSEAARIEALKP